MKPGELRYCLRRPSSSISTSLAGSVLPQTQSTKFRSSPVAPLAKLGTRSPAKAQQKITIIAAAQLVIARTAVQDIIVLAAAQRVLAARAIQDVIARFAVQQIV